MRLYSVYVGPYFLKSFSDEDSANFFVDSLSIFFKWEHLNYEASIKCEEM